jgi:hypothetical protein
MDTDERTAFARLQLGCLDDVKRKNDKKDEAKRRMRNVTFNALGTFILKPCCHQDSKEGENLAPCSSIHL